MSDSPAVRTRTVDANGLHFEVDECGEGDRLALCLHGFPEHSHSWRFQLPMLSTLGYRAWAPNLRGYGNSSRPHGTDAYSIENLMADVAGLIDASGCRETILLAHDWGAVIAWYFAMRAPRPLQRLVICNVPHPGLAVGRKISREQLKKSWYIFFFQIPWLPEKLLGRNGARAIGEMMRASAVDKTHFDAAACEVYRRNAAQPGALTAMINYYRALVLGGGMARQKAIGYPVIGTKTLMVWGEDDVALTKETTYGTDKFVRDLTIRYLPRVSHWVQQEQPEIVNAMIRAFLLDEPVPELKWEARLQLPG
jgi:pimeloyl-ACP methyl ester carboxylesterase